MKHLWREGFFSISKHLLYLYRYNIFLKNDLKHVTLPSPYINKANEKKLLFSIITPAYKSNSTWLLEAIFSVQNQSYTHWQLCLGLSEIDPILKNQLNQISNNDSRILLIDIHENKGISQNSNIIASHVTGDYIGFLDHDDILKPDALLCFAEKLKEIDYDIIYSDEERISEQRYHFFLPLIKPNWAPDTFLSYNYFCHFTCIKTSLFRKLSGFNQKYDGAQDYDLFLRATEQTQNIGHVRKVLYSWRVCRGSSSQGVQKNKPYAKTAGLSALQDHLNRIKIPATVTNGFFDGSYQVNYPLKPGLSVDIIIASANKNNTLIRCINSILSKQYDFSVSIHILLNNDPCVEKTLSLLPKDKKLSIEISNGPFNFSAINNKPGFASNAELLLFLNDDIIVQNTDWLANLVQHAQRDEIGAVGSLLLYPQGKIQHSGLTLSPTQIAVDLSLHYKSSSYGLCNRAKIIQNVSAVTGACLCTKQKLFTSLGGFDEKLALGYNDIDYCLKASQSGKRILYTPFCQCIHHESLTRGLDNNNPDKRKRLGDEIEYMKNKWGHLLNTDPYYSFEYLHKRI